MDKRLLNFFNICLLAWYLFCPFLWLLDNTLSFNMKINYAIINYIVDIVIFRIIYYGYKSPSFMDYFICPLMIVWFTYSTIRDYTEPGYTLFFKFLYVSVDIASFLFFLDTLLSFVINSKLLNDIFEDRIKKISNYMRGIVFLFGSIFCLSLLKRGA